MSAPQGFGLPPKFPFWSAIITQTQNAVSVAAGASGSVVIQPPSGETWLVWIDEYFDSTTSGNEIEYQFYSGSAISTHNESWTLGSYGIAAPTLGVLKILTNSSFGRLYAYNKASAAVYFYYGYSGFKLSKPLWNPTPTSNALSADLKPWKRPATSPLPSAISALSDFAFDILGADPSRHNDYATAIILEEDTPLAIDSNTNFPVERYTAVVKADVLANLIAQFKAGTADPVATGYKKYLDKWAQMGIKLV